MTDGTFPKEYTPALEGRAYDALGNKLPNPDDLGGDPNEPAIAWGMLVKKETMDGMIKLVDDKYIGTRIAFDLRSIVNAVLFNSEVKKYHSRPVIYRVPPDDDSWLPIELLDFSELEDK